MNISQLPPCRKEGDNILIRGRYIEQLSSGLYAYLPLGVKVLDNLINYISYRMNPISIKFQSPSLQPYELWEKSGRADSYGKEMLSLTSRDGKRFVLGPTAEEVICYLFKVMQPSLPVSYYQITPKYIDELRPQGTLLRTKEFYMKDAYSFHPTEESLDNTYTSFKETYEDILKALRLPYEIKVADCGEIGGSFSEEFYVNGVEVAHLFKLGRRYSNDLPGQPYMGCYGIGISRLIQVIASTPLEEFYWPEFVTPFDTHIICLDSIKNIPYRYRHLNCLVDDREVSAGCKFNDAKLIGIPRRIILSKKNNELNRGEEEFFGKKSYFSL